jgi:hypothetical protein
MLANAGEKRLRDESTVSITLKPSDAWRAAMDSLETQRRSLRTLLRTLLKGVDAYRGLTTAPHVVNRLEQASVDVDAALVKCLEVRARVRLRPRLEWLPRIEQHVREFRQMQWDVVERIMLLSELRERARVLARQRFVYMMRLASEESIEPLLSLECTQVAKAATYGPHEYDRREDIAGADDVKFAYLRYHGTFKFWRNPSDDAFTEFPKVVTHRTACIDALRRGAHPRSYRELMPESKDLKPRGLASRVFTPWIQHVMDALYSGALAPWMRALGLFYTLTDTQMRDDARLATVLKKLDARFSFSKVS